MDPFLDWRGLDDISKAVVFGLLCMAIHACLLFLASWIHFQYLRLRSRSTRRELDAGIPTLDPRKDAYLVPVLLAGRTTFHEASLRLNPTEALNLADSAMRRISSHVQARLQRDIGSLATITVIAPLVGLLATCFGVLDSFRAWNGSRLAGMMFVSGNISDALIPTALSLAIGIFSLWCHNLLARRVELLAADIDRACLQLLTHLRQGKMPTTAVTTEPFLDHFELPSGAQGLLLTYVWLIWLYPVCLIAYYAFR